MSYFEDVLKWHRAMGLPEGRDIIKPKEFEAEEMQMAVGLVREEFYEMMKGWSDKDVNEVADGAADLVWVVCGLMARMGVDLDSVWEGVKKANFAKAGGPKRADGKLLKPPGWTPPDTKSDIANGRKLWSVG